FPHQKLIRSPLIVESKLRNSKYVLLFEVYVHIVRGTGKGGGLDESTYRSGIVTLDFAFVFGAEAFDLPIVPWKLSATTPHVNRITANELLLARILQVLPARHPGDR